MATMIWVDWVIIGVISFSTLISVYRGFFKEAMSLLIWVTAFVIARLFSFNLAVLLENYVEVYSVRLAVAFGALFIATLIVGALVNHLIATLVRATGLTGTDRLLGAVFGAARGALLMVVAVALLKNTALVNDAWWNQSDLIPHFMMLEEWSFTIFRDLANYLLNISQ